MKLAQAAVMSRSTKNANVHKEEESQVDNISREELWAQAFDEFERGELLRGLWAQCFSESDGDQAKAKVVYLRKRVVQLQEKENLLIEQAGKVACTANEDVQHRKNSSRPYLSKPIQVHAYMLKYRVTENEVRQAILKGKIRSELIDEVLWMEDQPIKNKWW